MKFKKIIALLLTLVILVPCGFRASADSLKDKQNQYNNIKNQINADKDQQDDLRDKITDISNQINTLNASMTSINQDIGSVQVKIDGLQTQINSAVRDLNAAEADYNNEDQLMQKRIKAIYTNGTSLGYLEILLQSRSFSEFITNSQIMEKIIDYDINMLKVMKSKRDEINKKKVDLEQKNNEQLALMKKLNGDKSQLVQQAGSKKSLVKQYNTQIAELQQDINDETAAANRVEQEIQQILQQSNDQGNYDGSKYAILHRSDFPKGVTPVITSPFGYRTDPITGQTLYHAGLDIATMRLYNRPVYAMAPGKVVIAKYDSSYGNYVVIDHGGGLMTLYAHNNKLLVSVGQRVAGGQQISLSGSTGRSTGPHVHFGVSKNGKFINPVPYYMLGN